MFTTTIYLIQGVVAMEPIAHWPKTAIQKSLPNPDMTPLPGKLRGKLRLSPVQLLDVIHSLTLAEWALEIRRRFTRPILPRGQGSYPFVYPDSGILLMAVIQAVWHKSYEQIVDYVTTQENLVLQLGFTQRTPSGALRTISKGQNWERRTSLGLCPSCSSF